MMRRFIVFPRWKTILAGSTMFSLWQTSPQTPPQPQLQTQQEKQKNRFQVPTLMAKDILPEKKLVYCRTIPDKLSSFLVSPIMKEAMELQQVPLIEKRSYDMPVPMILSHGDERQEKGLGPLTYLEYLQRLKREGAEGATNVKLYECFDLVAGITKQGEDALKEIIEACKQPKENLTLHLKDEFRKEMENTDLESLFNQFDFLTHQY